MELEAELVMRYLLTICCALIQYSLLAQLSPVKVTDHITVSLPTDFRPMTEQEINSKFVYTRRPMALYTDYSASVDFTISRAYNRWNSGDLDILKDFYKANIMSLYDEVTFLKETMEEIDGKNFAVFEFTALIKPEEDAIANDTPLRTYNYIQYTIINNSTLVFNLSCALNHMRKWKDVAPDIMRSVTIKKNFK